MIKKRIGITLFLGLLLVMAVAFSGCGGNTVENGEDEVVYKYEGILNGVLDIEHNPVYISFETSYMDENVHVDLYIKDNNVRIDTKDKEAGIVSLITNEDGNFVVYKDHGLYVKTSEKAEAENFFSFIKKDLDNYEISVSLEEMMGEMLEAETLKGEEEEITFYFLGDIWVALSINDKDSQTLMNIISVGNDLEDDIFLVDESFKDMTGAF